MAAHKRERPLDYCRIHSISGLRSLLFDETTLIALSMGAQGGGTMNITKSLSRLTIGAALLAGSIAFAATGASKSSSANQQGTSAAQSAQGAASGAAAGAAAGASQGAKQAMSYEVVEFAAGSSDLTDSAKASIQSLVDKARASGDVKKVHIAAWSDKDFPKGKAELPKADRELATKRIDAINNYVKKDLKISNVDDHNMAKKTGWLARAFNTEDAELKSLFAQRGAPVTNVEFQTLKSAGGPMKALVWPEMANKK
jgi:hypothetical protein